ncbi:hypothetical protein C8R45DRAFT_995825 [Mycena sanguinolenta]|nr:hypothetical protein C8R45DRAFT_995825 [Mycena sanguinolenta]
MQAVPSKLKRQGARATLTEDSSTAVCPLTLYLYRVCVGSTPGMAPLQAHTAWLIALFISCVLYGILLTTFVPCLRSLLFSGQKLQVKPRHEIKWPVLAATISMFIVSTFSAVVSMKDVIDAFINYPGGALEFYNGGSTVDLRWMHWIPGVEDNVQVILGDGLLIYRCYVLYARNWRVIIVPIVAWMALIAMAIASSVREATLEPGQKLNDPNVLPFLQRHFKFC